MEDAKLNPANHEDRPIEDDENPELTEEDFARGRPFKEVFPEQYAQWEASGGAPIPVKPIG